jgi:tetratricopeptide (TPR) repeat protein
MGKSAAALKRYSDAEEAFQNALAIDPDYAWVLKERGELFLTLEKYEQALADLSKTINTNAVTAADLLERAKSYQKMGVVFEKDNRYNERQDVLRKAKIDLDEALKIDPEDSDSLWYLGVVLHDMYAYDQAEEIYLKAIETNQNKDSQDVAILRWNIGKARNQWALIIKDASLHKKSVEALAMTSAKLTDPIQISECLGDQGQAYLALNDYGQALSVFTQACEVDSNNAQLLYLRGKAAYLMGELDQADNAFVEVLNLQSGTDTYFPYAWVGRGLIAEAQEMAEQSAEAFSHALGGDGAVTAAGLVDRADAFEGLLAFDRATEDLEQAIDLEPDNSGALNSLAWLYVEKLPTPDHLAHAVKYAERAIHAQSDIFWRCNFLDTLGWAHYKSGNFEQAKAYLTEAFSGLPEPFEIRYHLEQTKHAFNDPNRHA